QVRHYTYGGDLARGIRLAMESPRAVNEDFNLSTAQSTTVRELAETIWLKVHGDGRPLRLVSDPAYEHDVQRRVPDVRKAREVLVVYDFDADTTVPVVERLQAELPELRLHRNDVGRGVVNALKSGLAAAGAPFVLVTMGDASDDPGDIDAMYALAHGGADVVA